MKPTFKDATQAFDLAIQQGRLSLNAKSELYAGNYMYMGTWSNGIGEVDQFKHIFTRRYLDARKEIKK